MKDSEAFYKRGYGKGLVEVRYRNGVSYKTTAAGLETIFAEQDYLSKTTPDIGPGDIVIDIGAHMGALSLQCAARQAVVFAYEANPYNFQVLELNAKRNSFKSLHCFPFAVSKTIGKSHFKLGKSQHGFLENVVMDLPSGRNNEVIEVQTTTLPSIFNENHIDCAKFIKMDCEGSEYDILFAEGMETILPRCCHLIIEVHPVRTKYNKYDLYSYLTRWGFRVKVVNETTGLPLFYCDNLNAASAGAGEAVLSKWSRL